jgi:hypothetical protein
MDSGRFDTRAVIVTNEILEDGEPLSLTVTVNTACTVSCPVTVSFGTQPVSSGSCEFQQNVTSKMPLSPGDTTTLSVEAGSVTIQSGETYCYLVTLCGNPVHEGSGGGGGLPSAAVGGIVAGGAVTLLVTLAIITGLCLLWFYHKQTRCYKQRDNTTGVVAIECQGHCEDMPQMSKKNDQGKEKEVETGQQELTEEEKADLYSVPDKKRFQTAEGPVAIEHQEGPSGDCILYTVPQKPKKNKGKEKKENAGQEDLTEEEKAALHSVPDKKRQKFKTAGEVSVKSL